METTKQCKSCNKIKTISNFTIKRSNQDGYMGICKDCKKDKDTLYKRTPDGIITKCYSGHKSRAKKEDYKIPYTKQQLTQWLKNQPHFIEIYQKWIDNNYHIDYYPSVSKIDKHKRYSIDNIKLMGWTDKLDEDHVKAIDNKERTRLNEISDRKGVRDEHIEKIALRTHKICIRCKKSKGIKEFHNNKNALDGRNNEYLVCINLQNAQYLKTKDGTSHRIHKSQVLRSERKGFSPPTYSLGELREWLYAQEIFHKTYVMSGLRVDMKQ